VCGIAGILSSTPMNSLPAEINRMNIAAAHRGPDDSGVALFKSDGSCISGKGELAEGEWTAGLGHQRLAIIDLSPAGHQPMSDPSGRYWVVYNGEVYNYLELRIELKSLGWRFRTATDTEVILYGYLQWGPECLNRFNGMWAFVILDRETGDLFCARDRFGIKPFHYFLAPGKFAFASEIKQLMALPWISKAPNRRVLADLFLWGLETHTEETFFEGIKVLPASHYMMISSEDVLRGRLEPVRYWRPVPGEPLGQTEAIERFRELFLDSVRLRLRSDVRVGVTLSGGLDSSSVVCAAGLVGVDVPGGGRLAAFNVEYEDEGCSERLHAEIAAGRAGAELTVLNPAVEFLSEDWESFIRHMEQPVPGFSYFSNFNIYRTIREHGTRVVLNGQGGDELLFGYERYRTYYLLFALKAFRFGQALEEIRNAGHHGNMPLRGQMLYGLYFSFPGLRAWRRRRLVRPVLKRDFYREYAEKDDELVKSATYRNRISMQTEEVFRYQLPHLLHHEDRMSMASSVETRLPFLDYRLYELVLSLPMESLLHKGWSKYLLREAMGGVLPDEIRWRTDKMGFETPTKRMINAKMPLFRSLLRRHSGDGVVNTQVVEKLMGNRDVDERLLSSVFSYLTWKELFDLA